MWKKKDESGLDGQASTSCPVLTRLLQLATSPSKLHGHLRGRRSRKSFHTKVPLPLAVSDCG